MNRSDPGFAQNRGDQVIRDSEGRSVRYKVLMVEDQATVAYGTKNLIQIDPDLRVCAIVANVRDIEAAIDQHRPDVVLMDLYLPDENGSMVNYDAINQRGLSEGLKLKMKNSEIGVLFTSALFQEATVRIIVESKHEGGLGFIRKWADPVELRSALKLVAQGKRYTDYGTTSALLMPTASAASLLKDRFTRREIEVLKAIASGLSRREVAAEMSIEVGVVDNYLERIRIKLRDAGVSIGGSQVYSYVHLTHLAIAINLVGVLPIQVTDEESLNSDSNLQVPKWTILHHTSSSS